MYIGLFFTDAVIFNAAVDVVVCLMMSFDVIADFTLYSTFFHRILTVILWRPTECG